MAALCEKLYQVKSEVERVERARFRRSHSFKKLVWSMSLLMLICFCKFALVVPSQMLVVNSQDYFIVKPEYSQTQQISPPPIESKGSCTQDLMRHSFGNSWNRPYVGSVDFREVCKPDFIGVTLNMTTVSIGRQYDRLGVVFLGDVEIWRTSTLEPGAKGTYSTQHKDVSKYASLFAEHQTLLVEIGNTVDDVYTGYLNVTLSITYHYHFTSRKHEQVADLILPLSSRRSHENQTSLFSIDGNIESLHRSATMVMLPNNTLRARIEFYASGNADEEFWYSNVPDQYTHLFPDNPLVGGGSFREIQVFLDGQIIGFAWPFPVIFTGGVSPGLWKPLVAIDAFDQQAYELDLTPWLGQLCDGKPHKISFSVYGAHDNINSNWYLSGSLHLFRNSLEIPTTGHLKSYHLERPPIQSSLTWTKHSPEIRTSATRFFRVEAVINNENISWTQNLSDYSNIQSFHKHGVVSNIVQLTKGFNSLDSNKGYKYDYAYPLLLNSSYLQYNDSDHGKDGFEIDASIRLGKTYHRQDLDHSEHLNTTQWGKSSFSRLPGSGNSLSTGFTDQYYHKEDDNLPSSYTVMAHAVNGTLKKYETKY